MKERIAEAMRVSINMQPDSLVNFISNPEMMYSTLHGNRLAETKRNPDTYKDHKRLGFDWLVFGPDGHKLVFGALSLGGIGLFSYGAACMILKDELNCRMSFLEGNSFSYIQNNPPAISVRVPKGARALWSGAPTLAVLKHESVLVEQQEWSLEQLRDLILCCEGDKRTDRFIEAQFAKPFSLGDIEKIVYEPAVYRSRVTITGLMGEVAKHSGDIAEATVAKHAGTLADTLRSSGELAGIEVEVISDTRTGGTRCDQ